MKKEADKRTEAISIKLTKEEIRLIEEIAEREFDYPSSWIRRKIFEVIINENQKEQK